MTACYWYTFPTTTSSCRPWWQLRARRDGYSLLLLDDDHITNAQIRERTHALEMGAGPAFWSSTGI